jgi:hypothetical protein
VGITGVELRCRKKRLSSSTVLVGKYLPQSLPPCRPPSPLPLPPKPDGNTSDSPSATLSAFAVIIYFFLHALDHLSDQAAWAVRDAGGRHKRRARMLNRLPAGWCGARPISLPSGCACRCGGRATEDSLLRHHSMRCGWLWEAFTRRNSSLPISRTVETSVCCPDPGYVPTGARNDVRHQMAITADEPWESAVAVTS